MEVKLDAIFYICVLITMISAKNVKSKPESLPEDYGASVEETGDMQGDDYYDGDDTENTAPGESNATTKNAEFRTQPMMFSGPIGQTVYLPCDTSDPDVVLAWYKNTTFLYQGIVAIITNSTNTKAYPNGTLAVTITSEADYGEYSCKMLTQPNPPSIVHIIGAAPTIISITSVNNQIVYKVGETLRLTCHATGHPKPKITWHKEGEKLGTEGETLEIPQLKFKNAGVYTCFADNKIPRPANAYFTVHIDHKPIVSVEKYMVNSDKEHDAELKCSVRAYPPPIVVWKKNGVNIVEDPPKVILKKHENNMENILLIKNLSDDDFAQYTCSAKNTLGKVEKSIKLVKTPVVQEFVKPEKASKDVVLTWKIDSKAPISKHQLQYKKKDEVAWKELEPEVSHKNGVYTLNFTLTGLEPGSYETRVRSENAHGWSDFSEVMPFEGVLAKHHKPHNKKHQKEKDMKEKQTTSTSSVTPQLHRNIDHADESASESVKVSAGCATVVSSAFLISIALLTTFFNRQ